MNIIIDHCFSNWDWEVVPKLAAPYGENILTECGFPITNFAVPPSSTTTP